MSHFNLTCAQNKGPSTTRLFSKFHSLTPNFIRCSRVRRVFNHQTEQETAKYIVSPHFQNFLPLMQQPNVGHGRLILEVSRSHTHTHTQSAGLLWTRNRPVVETSTWQHNIHNRQAPMPPAGFETPIPASNRPQTLAPDRSATGIGKFKSAA